MTSLDNQEASPSKSARGTLQTYNLGVLTLRQLSNAINWLNEEGFPKPAYRPWANLAVSDTSYTAPQSPPDMQPPQVGSQELESRQEATPSSTEEQEVSITETLGDNGNSFVEDAQGTHPTASTEENCLEEITAIREELSNVEDSRVEAPVAALDKADPNPSIPDATVTKTVTSVTSPKRESAQVRNVMPTIERKTSKSEPTDQYLHRLESLVLQLNLQLAQSEQKSQAGEVDYLQWLGQRVIELSLENMKLTEELRSLQK